MIGVGSAIGSFVDPDNDGSFSVDDIINDNDRGQALFRANDDRAIEDRDRAAERAAVHLPRDLREVDILNQSGR